MNIIHNMCSEITYSINYYHISQVSISRRSEDWCLIYMVVNRIIMGYIIQKIFLYGSGVQVDLLGWGNGLVWNKGQAIT